MSGEAVKALAAGTVISGRYRVLRRINSGAMGAVYEVEDPKTGRRLALKTLLPGKVPDDALVGRFRQEASILAVIDSEHVVKVEDHDEDRGLGLVYFTMDLLAGKDLDSVLNDEGPLVPERVARLLWQVGLALSAVHDAGIVHRDLKPSNLFLKRRDDHTELVKILDFGVAKVVDSRPGTTAFVGTPLYMPPEQMQGQAPDPRSDVYALAHVAFTLLTGHAFLEGGFRTEPATRRAARYGITLPPGFDAWFEHATALRLEDRFDTATELVSGLYRALGLEPPSARREPGPRAPVAPELPIAVPGAAEPRGAGSTLDVSAPAHALEHQSTVAVASSARSPVRGLGLLGAGLVVLLAGGALFALSSFRAGTTGEVVTVPQADVQSSPPPTPPELQTTQSDLRLQPVAPGSAGAGGLSEVGPSVSRAVDEKPASSKRQREAPKQSKPATQNKAPKQSEAPKQSISAPSAADRPTAKDVETKTSSSVENQAPLQGTIDAPDHDDLLGQH